MRKLLRNLFRLTLIALGLVIATILFGDLIFQRTSPAVRLVYDVQSPGSVPVAPAEMAAALKQRIDGQDMREIAIRPVPATQRVEILAPATVPKGDVKRVVQMGGVLSFHVVVEDPNEPGVAEMIARIEGANAAPQPRPNDTFRWLPYAQSGAAPVEATAGGVHYALVYATPDRSMTHEDPSRRWSVTRAQPAPAQGGGRAVAFELDKHGAQLFGDLTGNNIGRRLAIVLDGNVLSAPQVNSRIERNGIISGGKGGFSQQETNYLVSTLNAGSLPAKLSPEPVSEDYLTMTLGLPPMTRFLLKVSAIVLALVAVMVLIARMILRRLRPTAAEAMDRLLDSGAT